MLKKLSKGYFKNPSDSVFVLSFCFYPSDNIQYTLEVPEIKDMKDYEENLNSTISTNSYTNQTEFEYSMESIEDVIHTTCSKCGKVTVDECTVSSCEEPSCEFEQLGELYYSPGYQELMFDDEGNLVKNFLGKEK